MVLGVVGLGWAALVGELDLSEVAGLVHVGSMLGWLLGWPRQIHGDFVAIRSYFRLYIARLGARKSKLL